MNLIRSRNLSIILVFCTVFCNLANAQTDKEFWFAAPEVDSVKHPIHGLFDRPILLRITSESKIAKVKISMPANSSFNPIQLTVPANATNTVDLTAWMNQIENDVANSVQNRGLLIESSENITVYYEVQSFTCHCNPELFALKGSNALGNSFYIPSQTTWAIDTIRFPNAKAAFDIVATQDGTNITITPSKALIGRPKGVPFNITLNKGQTFSCQGLYHNGPNLLNGSIVLSNKPVAITTKEDLLFSDGDCADLAGDQLIPVSLLGTEYAVVRGNLTVRDKAVVLATENGTKVFLNGNATAITTINAGQSYEVDLTNAPAAYIQTSAKAYVLHYTGNTCEVGSAVIPKLNCTGSKSVSIVRSDADGGYVLLVTKAGNQGNFKVNGNGAVITAGDFSPLPGTGGAYVYCKKEIAAYMPLNAASIFTNNSGVFQLGFLNGSSFYGGCLYGYFSDYKKIRVLNQQLESCATDSVQLEATGGVSYSWSPSTGLSNPSIANPKAAPGFSTLYKVIITDEFGCIDSGFVDLTIKGANAVDFIYEHEICDPRQIRFYSSDSTTASNWNFGDGVSVIANSPTHFFQSQGNYQVSLSKSGVCGAFVNKLVGIHTNKANIITTSDTIVCKNGSIKLLTNSAEQFCWSPAINLDDQFSASPTANALQDITYSVNSKKLGTNLIVNGDFSAGNTGFTSQYLFADIGVMEGRYLIDKSPTPYWSNAPICTDHTNGLGNMMLVNGASIPGVNVWKQTITVTPNTLYEFSCWVENISRVSFNLCKLQFAINGVPIGTPFRSDSAACSWKRFFTNWNSGNATTAIISIVNQSTDINGNDFALDDISFTPVFYQNDSVKIIVENPSINAGNDTSICIGSSVQLQASGMQSYSWSPSAGLNATNIPNPIASPIVNTTYVVTGKTSNGCLASDTVNIFLIQSSNTLDYSIHRDICNPFEVQFQGSAVNATFWNFGDGTQTVQQSNPTHLFPKAGNYIVKMWDIQGQCHGKDTVIKSINLDLNIADIISTRDTTICDNAAVQLQSVTASEYCWSPATYLNNTTIRNPVATPLTNITYSLRSKRVGDNVIVNGDFNAGNSGFTSDYSFANPNVTEGQYFVGVNPQSWNAALSKCVDHTSGTGNMLLVNGSTVPDVKVWSQTIAVQPNTNYEFSTWIQALWPPNPAKLQFSINGVNLGNVITASLPTCTWTKFNTNWNSGSTTTAVISIVNKNTEVQGNDFALDDIFFAPYYYQYDSVKIFVEKPLVRTGNDTAVCPGSIVQLQAQGASSYSWTPTAGLTDPGIQNPVATITNDVTFIVKGTSAKGCLASDTIVISTLPTPVVSTSPDTTICDNGTVQLSASGGLAFQWSPVNGLNNPAIANPIATATASTRYHVVVTGANGCFATDSITINVASKPEISISNDTSICRSGSAQLQATGGMSYDWSPPGSLSNPAISNPIASPTSDTKYLVSVTNAEGCTSIDSVSVSMLQDPLVVVSSDTSICKEGGALLLAGGASTYIWSPAIGLSNHLVANPVAQPAVSTTYTVTGTDINGCKADASVNVLLLPVPAIVITPDTAICINSNIVLSASGGLVYQWSPSSGLSDPTIPNPVASPSSATRYYVAVKDNKGCVAADSVLVSFRPPAQFGVKSSDINGCAGQQVQLEAFGGDQYNWTPALGLSNSQIANPTLSLQNNQVFMVTIKESTCNTGNSYPVNIIVEPVLPIVISKSNDITCNTPTATLDAGNSAVSYSWSPATGLSRSDIANPVAFPAGTTTYEVTAQTAAGCISKGSIELKVINNGDFRYYQVPNAFTPNGDGNNDCFGISKWGPVKVVYFEIFNRWGQMVFNGKNGHLCWDGSFSGIKQPSGNYVYKLRVETMCGIVDRKGYVILIR